MATMVQNERGPDEGYSPDMDGETHERTYDGFVHFTTVSTLVVLCWVMALALGGVKDAWFAGIVGVIASMVAGAIGGLFPTVGWRAPGVVLGLMTLVFVFA